MIELGFWATLILVLGTLMIPRTTFLITWFFNTVAVSYVLGGSALILAVLGFIAFPRIMFTYFLLESVTGAPSSGAALYWIYLGIAAACDVSTKSAAANRNEAK